MVTLALSAAAICGGALGAQTTSSLQPAATSVDVLVLPASGDPATVAPLAVLNSPIAADQNCGFEPSLPLDAPVVNPMAVEFADPFTADRACRASLPPLPNGTAYRAVVVLIQATCVVAGVPQANCRSARSSLAVPLSFDVQKCGAFAVQVAVGNWSRTVAPGDVGQVTFSLRSSLNPVTLLIVRLNGQEQDRLTGSDLRKVAGSYFEAPNTPGSYALSVEAQDTNACADGASRPMTVEVKSR